MRRSILLSLVTFFLFSLFSLNAGDDLVNFSLQIRHRLENDGKDFSKLTKINSFNLLRTRFGLMFKPVKNMSAFIQIQDSRNWGEEFSTLADGSADNLDIHQAYFTVDKLFGLPVRMKLGRIEASYGPERLIGAVGWDNIGRSFDGVVFTVHSEKMYLDFFSMKEVENNLPGNIDDKNFMGVYGKFKIFPNYQTHAFVLIQSLTPTDNLSKLTAGLYLKGKHGKFRHELEFAYQSGKMVTTGEMDIAAMMVAANLGYKISDSGISPDISFGVDFLTGDDDSTDTEYKVFDTLYATNHKYYGYMDYFLNIPVHTYGLGLMDINATLSIKPFSKSTASIKYHNFTAATDYSLLSGTTSKAFGSEIDFTFSYKYNKFLKFVLGASFFTPGDIFKELRGEDSGSWIYLMTTFDL